MLSTVANRRGSEGSLPPPDPASASRSRLPHVFPWLGKGVFSGLASAPVRVTPRGSIRESQRLFHLRVGDSVPGPDDPSTPASPVGVVGGEGCLPRSCLRRPQRLDGFYDREFVARCAANFMSRFMPDPTLTRNKNNRAQSLFLSTELSTALSSFRIAKITAHRESCGRFHRKSRREPGDVENNYV